MGIESDKGIQQLERIIEITTLRHKVLASNIANVDTPGYKAKDISFKAAMAGQSLKLTTTNPDHIQGTNNPGNPDQIIPEERPSWKDGNNVALDMEMASMTENGLLYEAGVQLLSTKLQMYKDALK